MLNQYYSIKYLIDFLSFLPSYLINFVKSIKSCNIHKMNCLNSSIDVIVMGPGPTASNIFIDDIILATPKPGENLGESALKHGDIINGSLKVSIQIKTEGNVLFFEIKNTSIKENKINNGIGLENIAKRLEMLYPNSHTLEISQTANHFKVNLTINNLTQFKNG